jgi:hypothetical protein
MKRNRIRGLDVVQFAGLVILLGLICWNCGPGTHPSMASSVTFEVVIGGLALMTLTTLRARE